MAIGDQRLERIEDKIDDLHKALRDTHTSLQDKHLDIAQRIAVVETKAKFMSGVGGVFGGVIVTAINLIFFGKK